MILKKLLLILSVLISGCAVAPVPDVEVCGRLRDGAVCAFTISDDTRRISEIDWQLIALGRMSMTAADYGAVKKFILESCERSVDCNRSELEKKIIDFDAEF